MVGDIVLLFITSCVLVLLFFLFFLAHYCVMSPAPLFTGHSAPVSYHFSIQQPNVPRLSLLSQSPDSPDLPAHLFTTPNYQTYITYLHTCSHFPNRLPSLFTSSQPLFPFWSFLIICSFSCSGLVWISMSSSYQQVLSCFLCLQACGSILEYLHPICLPRSLHLVSFPAPPMTQVIQ